MTVQGLAKLNGRSTGNATMRDVASRAGVSVMTVSRVFNGDVGVLASTKARVEHAMKELHFSPNAAARSLASGKATRIGLLYANPSQSYLSQFLIGVLRSARSNSCNLIVEECDAEDVVTQAQASRKLVEAGVSGVMLPPPLSQALEVLRILRESRIPAVTVAMGPGERNFLNVRIDDVAAAGEIAQHLIQLGHRRFGFVRGDPRQVASIDRERGFVSAVLDAGLSVDDIAIAQGDFTFRSGLEAGEQLLRRKFRPTAIFASNDDMAAGIISAAHQIGLSVPDQLSVAGFDDTGVATMVWPELTTIRQPVTKMATAAFQLLINHLASQRGLDAALMIDKVFPYELVVRASSGPWPVPSAFK